MWAVFVQYEEVQESTILAGNFLYKVGKCRKKLYISESLKSILYEFMKGLVKEIEVLSDAIMLMGDNIEKSLPLVEAVDKIESELDSLHQVALSELETHVDKVDVLTLLNLRELVEFLEYAADITEDATDIVRIIVFKHGAWTF